MSDNKALGNDVSGVGDPPMGSEAVVACAIFCCDNEEYSLRDTRGGKNTCQRIANRKHSCVLRRLRELRNGELTTKNKYKNVLASPQCKAPNIERTLIPDTIVDDIAIDAKFPCNPEDAHKIGFTSGDTKKRYPSDRRTGVEMLTDKEESDYLCITEPVKVNGSKTMTPADAEALKGDCQC